MRGLAATRYRNPAACTAERRANSGLVSLDRFPRMLARVASDVAHDRFTSPMGTT